METSSENKNLQAQTEGVQTEPMSVEEMKKGSKYLERFKNAAPYMMMMGDNILVERLPKPNMEQRSKGGIILPTEKLSTYRHTHADDIMEFGIVLVTGPGQHIIGETGQLEILPCTTKPGDIILITDNIEWYSQFGHMTDYEPLSVGRMRDSNVMMMFTDYQEFIERINHKDEQPQDISF